VQLLDAFVWDDVSLNSRNRKRCVREYIRFIELSISFGITEEHKTLEWHMLLPEVIPNYQFKFQFRLMFSVT
jgi:hypothetical protein